MRLLVCGDRNWSNHAYIYDVLNRCSLLFKIDAIVEGAARGADAIAASWAIANQVTLDSYPAEWETFGKAAGPRRNQQMLNTKPDLVIAFHNDLPSSKGTKDMVERAKKAGLHVWVFPGEGDVILDGLESGAFL